MEDFKVVIPEDIEEQLNTSKKKVKKVKKKIIKRIKKEKKGLMQAMEDLNKD